MSIKDIKIVAKNLEDKDIADFWNKFNEKLNAKIKEMGGVKTSEQWEEILSMVREEKKKRKTSEVKK